MYTSVYIYYFMNNNFINYLLMYFLTKPKLPMTLTFEIVSGRSSFSAEAGFVGNQEIESKCRDSRL